MALIHICIVEDLKDVRDEIERLIYLDERFELIGSFSNAETATKELPFLQPDIVVMDINLPGMNGITCIKKVKLVCAKTQFIMFTVYENDENVFEALAAGASGYILKKTSFAKIIEALIELHQGGAPMSMQIARKVIDRMHDDQKSGIIHELTSRENEVLQWLGKGLLYKEIGNKLNISIGTVRQHIHNIYEKLHVQNRTEALNKLPRK